MKRFMVVAGLVLFQLGCQTVQAPGLPRTRKRVQPYDSSFEVANRTAILYAGFDRVISVSVTLFTPAYRAALDAELARLRHAQSRDALGLEQPPGGALDLVVFLDGRDPTWEDLEERAATFQVDLVLEGKAYPAHLVRRLDEDDSTLRHLFPHTGIFGRLYRLRVDGPPQLREGIVVRFTGGPGTLSVGF